jgi:hypothetical protein
MLTREQRDDYLNNLVRALKTTDSGVSDYRRLDYDEVIALVASIETPGSVRFRRVPKAKDITHYWLDQPLGDDGENAQNEDADPSESAANKPTRYKNTMQIQSKVIKVTDTMERVARAGGLIGVGPSELGRQAELAARLLLKSQERALFTSVEQTTEPRKMKGLTAWIDSTAKLDASAVQLTSSNIETYVNNEMYKLYDLLAGAMPNALYCGPRLLGPLGQAAKNKVQINVNLADMQNGGVGAKLVAGQSVGYFMTDFGTLELVYTPWLTAATTSGAASTSQALFLNEDAISIVDFVNGGMEITERAKTAPTQNKVITQEITLEVRYVLSHGMLHNWYV